MAAHHLTIRSSAVMLWFEDLGQKMRKAVKSLYCCSDVCVRVGGFQSQPFSDEEEGTCAGPSFDVGSF